MDFELLLFDRIEKIKQINKQYDLDHNAYIAFSGGKDSTVLHYLIDIALPNNKIPRLFMNTGVEYIAMLKFVKNMAKDDDRIVILNSGVKIKKMLNEYGYPFKSKQHAHNVAIYQNSGMTKTNISYLGLDGTKSIYRCPKQLKYQFSDNFNLKISEKCCHKLKKEPQHKWAKDHNKSIVLTGMRQSEGGNRKNLTCISSKETKIHFLAPVNDDFMEWFISKFNIKLCELYYPPYNFKRTGCKGCPFSLNLQEQLDVMKKILPSEYKQCWFLWKPVYDEYIRIDYRLEKPSRQLSIFDLEDLQE